mmetsp:Transcript_34024/g.85421  ORF Transcript_34024/g.85421 Transcript_34024/m.85421 type:complete len:208 (+) Transcript_34024:266-889(+)
MKHNLGTLENWHLKITEGNDLSFEGSNQRDGMGRITEVLSDTKVGKIDANKTQFHIVSSRCKLDHGVAMLDCLHRTGFVAWHHEQGVLRCNHTRLNLAGHRCAQIEFFVNVCDAKSERTRKQTRRRTECIDRFNKSRTIVPVQLGNRSFGEVLTSESTTGNVAEVLWTITGLTKERRQLFLNLLESRLTPLTRIHLVTCDYQLIDSQ